MIFKAVFFIKAKENICLYSAAFAKAYIPGILGWSILQRADWLVQQKNQKKKSKKLWHTRVNWQFLIYSKGQTYVSFLSNIVNERSIDLHLKSFVHYKSKFSHCILPFILKKVNKCENLKQPNIYRIAATRKSELAFQKVIRNWIQRTHMILNKRNHLMHGRSTVISARTFWYLTRSKNCRTSTS